MGLFFYCQSVTIYTPIVSPDAQFLILYPKEIVMLYYCHATIDIRLNFLQKYL